MLRHIFSYRLTYIYYHPYPFHYFFHPITFNHSIQSPLTMTSLSPENLLSALKPLTSNPPASLLENHVLRTKLRLAARDVSLALETPADALASFAFSGIYIPISGITLALFPNIFAKIYGTSNQACRKCLHSYRMGFGSIPSTIHQSKNIREINTGYRSRCCFA